ncbi:MAG TPA: hypothetical protein ENL11_03505 [Candidatus Acetothermia bacterium]|nr:hypothetical protein [Candidatus Acetothermia bacterium]
MERKVSLECKRAMADLTFGDVWSVLRWVLVVLAAGFIGQFGRYAAQRILERRRRKQASLAASETAALELKKEKVKAKVEKKKAKAEIKRAKKKG